MAKTTTTIQEQRLLDGKVRTRSGLFLDQGQAILTSQRFYFQARIGAWLRIFGLLGTLVKGALPVKVKVDIPLSSIAAIGRGRMGLASDVFFIETLAGKKYQFYLEHQLWLDALKDILQKQAGTTLVQTSQESWKVQR
jgi:hypothetical protein